MATEFVEVLPLLSFFAVMFLLAIYITRGLASPVKERSRDLMLIGLIIWAVGAYYQLEGCTCLKALGISGQLIAGYGLLICLREEYRRGLREVLGRIK
ncbi:hypothetical protein [Archaeoglobus veneficus]|uniref:Uncharacterized protein n=1 Tax=Archaeoglobus veneficus (strain DSM 11195 / SNP6) TaxID=693661 RepID=F2KRD2_ARCVS|nr:hypothetical protein [Archaeoglobus veneficus]AEA47866.1 hypothetical protein Arcve_1873 [Archaeoglobus veneficus SNP6]